MSHYCLPVLYFCFTSVLPMFLQFLTSVSSLFYHCFQRCFTSVLPVCYQFFSSDLPVLHLYFTSVLPVIYRCFTSVPPVFHQFLIQTMIFCQSLKATFRTNLSVTGSSRTSWSNLMEYLCILLASLPDLLILCHHLADQVEEFSYELLLKNKFSLTNL